MSRLQFKTRSRTLAGVGMDPDASFFRYFTILICAGAVNTSNSIPKQDFRSFAVKLWSRNGSKNFGIRSTPACRGASCNPVSDVLVAISRR